MFLQWGVPAALVPLYSVHLETLGFSEMQTASCCAAQAVAVVFASLVAGQVADRWLPAEKALAVCAALAGLDLWLLAELDRPLPVFLATLAFWLVTGPMLLLGTTISFSHLSDPHRHFGPVRLWGTVGWMVIGWVTGAGLELLRRLRGGPPEPDLADAMRIGGVLAWLVAGYALTLPHTPPTHVPGRSAWSRLVAPLGALRLLRLGDFATYAACLLGLMVTFPFTTQSTPLLLRQLGISPSWLMPTLTLAQTTEVLALAILPMLLLRLGLRGTMVLGMCCWAAAMGVLALGQPLGLVVASLGFNGFYVAGFLIAGQVYINGLAEGDLRASVQGLFGFVNGLGLLAGNLLAGWLRRWAGGELPLTFAVGAAITTSLLLVFLLGFRHRRQTAT
jgi:predicted MFS family arabinose efflux permease